MVEEALPLITIDAEKWLRSFLTPDMLAFEWGSGGSTVYIAKRVKSLVSVDHHAGYQELVQQRLQTEGIVNCKCIACGATLLESPVQEAGAQRPGPSWGYGSGFSPGNYFEEYARTIDEYPDGYFDFVFVDGRARTSCIYHAVDKVKPEGAIMLDNTERGRYKVVEDLLRGWEVTHFLGTGTSGGEMIWKTSIWQKPKKL